MAIRVVLIDDDPKYHILVDELLSTSEEIVLVGKSTRGEDAISICMAQKPDIVLMDVILANTDGADVTNKLLSKCPDVKVLALSASDEYEHILAMLNNGATSYLVKETLVDDLLDTIVSTYQGRTVLSAQVKHALINPRPLKNIDFGLTKRELEVVSLMGKGLTNREVAHNLGISSPTVSFHLKNILDKMGIESRSELLVLAAKHDLI